MFGPLFFVVLMLNFCSADVSTLFSWGDGEEGILPSVTAVSPTPANVNSQLFIRTLRSCL